MSDETDSVGSISFNLRLCARLRKPQHPSSATSSHSPPKPKLRVRDTVVQRLRHRNHQLAVEEFLAQQDAAPKVSQETALNHYARRAYNSLQSREMIAAEEKEAAMLRYETFTQMLGKEISRRHFRTAHRYDTGSKYPAGPVQTDQHGPKERDTLLTLMASRKLLSMADVLLAYPGSVRVGLQPVSDNPRTTTGAAGAALVGAVPPTGSPLVALLHPETGSGISQVSEPPLVAPSLDATRYALALYSPRSSPQAAGADAGTHDHARARERRFTKENSVRWCRAATTEAEAATGGGGGGGGGVQLQETAALGSRMRMRRPSTVADDVKADEAGQALEQDERKNWALGDAVTRQRPNPSEGGTGIGSSDSSSCSLTASPSAAAAAAVVVAPAPTIPASLGAAAAAAAEAEALPRPGLYHRADMPLLRTI
ncbi:hypothetical protein VOLCADRAFT_93826 [Volvox carteri f. nagariensis]|uniref:Uncharacterized protein n=1 Tax=Volvox carteri f. nagariensis TaxID=3068 RepID=D8U360_VOLCA|nr:uncharacterized protein VOLCADRAFT_93826 [Volvox carteri f. nagariensis]EFJ46020.1 hypothetical protein VOLCADRAFT_93826 [Volvox carteri f. nagariensis]|eukprot:XP_002953098.1 hypothetical protein VOLCADRAFT_93826 [Volvox carteri f. nagariensis]